jgi:hypothetical protein
MWVWNTFSRILPIGAVALGLMAGCQSSNELELRSPADTAARSFESADSDARPEPRASRVRDEVGHVTVSGGSVDDAPQVAQAMVPSFHRCKMRWAPKSTGEVQVAAKVGPVGEVRFATPEAADPMPPMLVACVRAKVANAKFAAPTGSDPTVLIPIKFAND